MLHLQSNPESIWRARAHVNSLKELRRCECARCKKEGRVAAAKTGDPLVLRYPSESMVPGLAIITLVKT